MTFVPVPWAVEGGASNGIDGARILAYAATSGNSGVMGFGDLRVVQLATPGAGVQMGTGVALIPNRAPGYSYQTYIGSRAVADDTVPVAANGGAATRYDLVVARVENPWIDGYPAPVSVTDGPYVAPRVLQGVTQAAATTRAGAKAYLKGLNMSAVPVAGIALPANTSSVLNAHLTDLRTVANPRTYRPPILTSNPSARANVPSDWANWVAPAGWTVDVPEWATRMTMVCTIYGAKLDRQSSSTDGHANGQMRLKVGTDGSAVTSQTTNYDTDAPQNSGATRSTVGVGDTIAVPAAYRDTTQPVALQADALAGNQPFYVDASSFVALTIEFVESAS